MSMSKLEEKTELFHVQEAANFLGISYRQIYKLVKGGKLRKKKIGKLAYVYKMDVMALKEFKTTTTPLENLERKIFILERKLDSLYITTESRQLPIPQSKLIAELKSILEFYDEDSLSISNISKLIVFLRGVTSAGLATIKNKLGIVHPWVKIVKLSNRVLDSLESNSAFDSNIDIQFLHKKLGKALSIFLIQVHLFEEQESRIIPENDFLAEIREITAKK